MSKTVSEREKETLRFWQERDIFGKSLTKENLKGDFIFYDGPPFATGTPHYGHFPSSFLKDVMPRYKTMRGYHVARRWGWDCHGLPIENIIEKELGFKTKKEIVEYGVAKFNEACRSTVLRYVDEWNKMIPRLGRWADMEHPYQTMDLSYMESVWWVFKQLWDKGLIYEGYKSMHVCPRCETTLSQQEVSEGYKDIKDISVTAKFKLESGQRIGDFVTDANSYMLAWTTTPWTLPGNVALAVGKDIHYRAFRLNNGDEIYIAAVEAIRDNMPFLVGEEPYFTTVKKDIKGNDLVGLRYKPLFEDYISADLENKENIYTTIFGDFVTTDEGTGIVHIAPAFGEDDMIAGQKNKLPFIQHVKLDGHISGVESLEGLSVKPIDDHQSTDRKIIEMLRARGLVFDEKEEEFIHSYPHCWRCDTPLINYATSSWFVAVTKIKPRALKLSEKINWSPEHIKAGRFGKWLEGARDWSISRQRFWASVMPIWKCECGDLQVFGSVAELEKASGKKVTDLHKHIVDEIVVPCKKCGKQSRRIPDVLDTWFDSGSMPYAQLHYPFENEKGLKKNFPAQFIAEGADQTRAWFYYLHILGTALFDKPAFENVIVNGIVLAEDGKKMSKRLKNYPDPNEVLEKYGADALRYYILTSPVVEADTLNFSESGVKESLQKTVMLILNVLSFYLMYKKEDVLSLPKPEHVLDKWILAKLQELNSEVTENLEAYDMVRAARPITSFINELSTWYLRRSRDRFKEGDTGGINTLGYVLREFSKLIAPFMPFVAEEIYQNVGAEKESVHLEDWPSIEKKLANEKIVTEMETVLTIVEKGLAARAEAGIKVRQPLVRYTTSLAKKLDDGLIGLVTDELNVKELTFDSNDALDTTISDELRVEGVSRELVRQINQMRKEQGLTIKDRITIYYQGPDEVFMKFGDELKKQTLADSIISDTADNMKAIGGGSIGIKKVNS